MKRMLVALCAVVCLALTGGERVDVNKDLALDVSKAGADFKVQGEYSGEITTADGKKKFGAHIMALGGGTFRAVYYAGGLPGDGWDGDTKLRAITAKEWVADGKTDGDKTVFEKPYAATLSGETLTGKNDKGEAFECKKVMRVSPTMGAKAPDGAVVLFDGTNLDQWKGGLQIDERKFIATAHGGGETKQKFQNYTLHLEYMEPFKPYGREQDRGNSGVYMQNRYECQVLDSFGRFGKDNEAGGIYHVLTPKLNMCFPPLSWQTYDIDFTTAKFVDNIEEILKDIATKKATLAEKKKAAADLPETKALQTEITKLEEKKKAAAADSPEAKALQADIKKLEDKKKAALADTPETKALQAEIKKLEDKKKSSNARITVKHNGVVIHDNAEIKEITGGGKAETPEGGEIQLQGHGNPVFYRNIWIVEKK